MEEQENFKTKNELNYANMIDYLVTKLNQAKSATIPNQLHNKPIFLFEFFVFKLIPPRELLRKIKQPLLAIRFLDFPTLTIDGILNYENSTIDFNQGKSSYFEMELYDLKDNLINHPMYIMFIDMNNGDMKVIGSSRLNISIFAYDTFLQYSGSSPQPRRNLLKLYDNTLEKIAEFEMSILIRREYYKYEVNSFPLNQENIIIQSNNKDNNVYQKNKILKKSTTSAKPYSNDLRMQNTDTLITSPHAKMIMEEKTKKEFYDNITKVENTNEEMQNYNSIYNNPIKDANDNRQSKYAHIDSSLSHPDDVWKKSKDFKKDAPSIKDLLNSSEKNPPPLYFYHSKPNNQSQERVIRIIKEDNQGNKEGKVNIKNLKESTTQTDKNVLFYYSKNANYNEITKRKTKKELKNDMYETAKEKYEKFIKAHPEAMPNKNTTSSKRKENINKKYESETIEQIEPNNLYEKNVENNEYLKIVSTIKNNEQTSQIFSSQIKEENKDETKGIKKNSPYKKEEEDEEEDYGTFNEDVKETNTISNNNIIQSVIESNNNQMIESNVNYDDNKFKEGKNIRQSNVKKESYDNYSLLNSVMNSSMKSKDKGNEDMKKKVSIQTEKENYDDFHSEIDEELRKETNENNKSKVVSEENIVKSSSKSNNASKENSHRHTNTNESQKKEKESNKEEKVNKISSTISNMNDTSEPEDDSNSN